MYNNNIYIRRSNGKTYKVRIDVTLNARYDNFVEYRIFDPSIDTNVPYMLGNFHVNIKGVDYPNIHRILEAMCDDIYRVDPELIDNAIISSNTKYNFTYIPSAHAKSSRVDYLLEDCRRKAKERIQVRSLEEIGFYSKSLQERNIVLTDEIKRVLRQYGRDERNYKYDICYAIAKLMDNVSKSGKTYDIEQMRSVLADFAKSDWRCPNSCINVITDIRYSRYEKSKEERRNLLSKRRHLTTMMLRRRFSCFT